ncbi:hypothetical protein THAOC_12224 [Thalassiosira oceanica]|uniref:JmjC domain-containing protein n=1 Tax=Thalassiosira oceanica TaxID=159749 RepID=K0SP98_THAOC|nr:hypothetical protein THAOC_12224 [Thalassiosira oceanica]|eukprot:EJK66814.1 hypothetical protein THAOC_12224 [Thalassiosira oceanica]
MINGVGTFQIRIRSAVHDDTERGPRRRRDGKGRNSVPDRADPTPERRGHVPAARDRGRKDRGGRPARRSPVEDPRVFTADFDWYFFRTTSPDIKRREGCFVRCLELMEKMEDKDFEFGQEMLTAAAFMGLTEASRVLVERHGLDPIGEARTARDDQGDQERRKRRALGEDQASDMRGVSSVADEHNSASKAGKTKHRKKRHLSNSAVTNAGDYRLNAMQAALMGGGTSTSSRPSVAETTVGSSTITTVRHAPAAHDARRAPQSLRRGVRHIFFGSDMSGATLHWHAAAFNILYVGTKEWHVTPPLYRGFTGTPAEVALERFANQPFGVRCTQLPGDLIYTRSLGTFDAESRVRDRRGEYREAASEGCAGGCLTKKVGWNA